MKCTNEKWKLKKILRKEKKEKKSKDQARNLPWMNLSLFSSGLGSAEEKPSKTRFKVNIVCFYRTEILK